MTAIHVPRAEGSVFPLVALLVAGVALGLGLVPVADASGLSPALAVAGGMGLVILALLAVARYDLAVGIAFTAMAVVKVEPAPPDACFAIVIAVATVTQRFRIGRVPRTAVWLVCALMVLNLLSMVDLIVVSEALKFFFITAYLLVFALWLTGYVDSERRSRLIVMTWLVTGVVSAVVATVALQVPFPGADLLVTSDGLRARGLFKDPNVYGPFLIPIAAIVLDQRLSKRLVRYPNWVMNLLFLVLTVGVIFSYSRAAWANFMIAVAVTLAASALRRRGGGAAMRVLVTLMVMAGLAASVVVVTGSLSFLEERARGQSYDTQRFGAQHYGYELGWSHPFGVGPGQFQYHHAVETHSTYVRTLAEQGFLGVSCWLALIIATLVMASRNVVFGRDTYGIGSAALLGSWCGLIFNSVVVDTLHWRHLWVVAALIWAAAVRDRLKARSPIPVVREAPALSRPAVR